LDAADVPQELVAVTVLEDAVVTVLVVPVPPPLHAKVQPVHGLEIVSTCEPPVHISTGPVGVTVGTTGSGLTVTETELELAEVPQLLVAVTVLVLVALTTLVVPVPPPLHAKVQPVQGLVIVSVCVLGEQMVTGPAGVTVGVTGSGLTVTSTELEAGEVPQLLVAVTVVVAVELITLVVPVPPPLHAKVQPVQGLVMVSVCVLGAQIVTGPVGVTIGVTGSGLTVTETELEVVEVPQELVAVTVLAEVALIVLVVPVPPPLQAKEQPVQGLEMVSICVLGEHIVTGPAGVTVGVVGPHWVAHIWKPVFRVLP
jgi:hypothetical protein